MTALAPYNPAVAQPIMAVDPRHVDYSAGNAARVFDQYLSRSQFPGDQYQHKQGIYTVGWGKKARELDRGFKKVVNAPSMMVAWRIWDLRDWLKDRDNGKQKQTVLPVAYPFAGQFMPGEDEIKEKFGHLPWRPQKRGDDTPPWERLAVLIIRDENSNKLDHMMFSSASGFRAAAQFASEVEAAMRSKSPDVLPLVRFGAERRENSASGEKFWVPTLEVVGWSPIQQCDLPGSHAQPHVDVAPDADEIEEDDAIRPGPSTAASEEFKRARGSAEDIEEISGEEEARPRRVVRRSSSTTH